MFVLPNPDYRRHPKFAFPDESSEASREADGLSLFLPAFTRSYESWLKVGYPDYGSDTPSGQPVLDEIQRDGVALLTVPAELKARMADATAATFAGIEESIRAFAGRPKFRHMNVMFERSEHGPLYKVVNQALDAIGVYEVARGYLRTPVKIRKLFAQVNNQDETARRYGPIDDDGLPALKTDYWHIDSDVWPCLKVLIYMSEVGPEQGPMRYVPGTHKVLTSFELIARKTNDTLKLPVPLFVSLPDAFRVHALFGPYLNGDEPEALAMLSKERVLCGPGKDVVLFDNNGVHRGGFVRSGSRHIIQCLFEPA
jgi:hypothetical protein